MAGKRLLRGRFPAFCFWAPCRQSTLCQPRACGIPAFTMGLTVWIQILDATGAIVGFASLFAILLLIGRNAHGRERAPYPRAH